MIRSELLSPASAVLNFWVLWRRPPISWAAPNTSNRLPRIEPVMDAFTRSIRPARRARIAMISSARLPRVALSRPPSVGPVYAAISSVARPRYPERGMIARALKPKISTGFACTYSAMIAAGTNRSRIERIFIGPGSRRTGARCHQCIGKGTRGRRRRLCAGYVRPSRRASTCRPRTARRSEIDRECARPYAARARTAREHPHAQGRTSPQRARRKGGVTDGSDRRGLVEQHDRDVVAHRIAQSTPMAHEGRLRLPVFEGALALRADEDGKQLRG